MWLVGNNAHYDAPESGVLMHDVLAMITDQTAEIDEARHPTTLDEEIRNLTERNPIPHTKKPNTKPYLRNDVESHPPPATEPLTTAIYVPPRHRPPATHAI
ncbi:unnamed protein product [Orchesella dallaii]|uniref:Uncharacterized protein n=1 Tax=Orchesella dallaii TaxID=48710 RepID=A0ABP1RRK2_9HEXA